MTETMLAGRMNYLDGSFGLKSVPVPAPARGEVRVRIRAAGICLSDIHLIDGQLGKPVEGEVTLGHEVAGEIDQLGEGVDEGYLGKRVLLNAGREVNGRAQTLGVDYDGGWAEYICVEVDEVLPIPDSLSFEEAAVIPDAVSTPWGAIEWTGQVRAGEAVGVWGIGGLGSHAVQLLRLIGAVPIVAIDPTPRARARALELGADLALDPSDPDVAGEILTLTEGQGLSVALEFAGVAPARRQALQSLRPGGRLVVIGIDGGPIVVDEDLDFHLARRQVLGHYGYERRHIEELVRWASLGRLDLSSSITLTLPLTDVLKGVELLSSQSGEHVRIVLVPGPSKY